MMFGQELTPQNEALQFIKQGRFPEAREVAARLIKSAADTGAGIPYRAGLHHLLGIAEYNLGRDVEAIRAFETGVQLCERNQGRASEILVSTLVSLAEVYTSQAHFKEAERTLRRATEVAGAELSPGHPRLASVFDGWGLLYLTQGQMSRAEASFRRALAILEIALNPSDPAIGEELGSVASVLMSMGRRKEALPFIDRSRQILANAYGPNHPETIFATYNFGVAQLASAPAEAEKTLRGAMAAWLTMQPERHVTVAAFLNAIAWARLRQRDPKGAASLSAQSLELARALLGPEHPRVMILLYDRASLLKAAKQGRDAAAARKEADRIRQAKGYPEPNRQQHSIDVRALRGLQ